MFNHYNLKKISSVWRFAAILFINGLGNLAVTAGRQTSALAKPLSRFNSKLSKLYKRNAKRLHVLQLVAVVFFGGIVINAYAQTGGLPVINLSAKTAVFANTGGWDPAARQYPNASLVSATYYDDHSDLSDTHLSFPGNGVLSYSVGALLGPSLDYSKPFIGFDEGVGFQGGKIRFLGIKSGAASISGSGKTTGSAYTVGVSNMRSFYGDVANTYELSYKWEKRIIAGGGWVAVTGTTHLYTILAGTGTFAATDTGALRVIVSDRAGLAQPQILGAISSNVEIDVNYTLSITFVSTPVNGNPARPSYQSAITHSFPNGEGTFNYQWQQGKADGSFRDMPVQNFVQTNGKSVTLRSRLGTLDNGFSVLDSANSWDPEYVSVRLSVNFSHPTTNPSTTVYYESDWHLFSRPATHNNGGTITLRVGTRAGVEGGQVVSYLSGETVFGFRDAVNGVGFRHVNGNVWERRASIALSWQRRKVTTDAWEQFSMTIFSPALELRSDLTFGQGVPAILPINDNALTSYFTEPGGEVRIAVTLLSDAYDFPETVTAASIPVRFFLPSETFNREIEIFESGETALNISSYDPSAHWRVKVMTRSGANVTATLYQWQQSTPDGIVTDIPFKPKLNMHGTDLAATNVLYSFLGQDDHQRDSGTPFFDNTQVSVRVRVRVLAGGIQTEDFSRWYLFNQPAIPNDKFTTSVDAFNDKEYTITDFADGVFAVTIAGTAAAFADRPVDDPNGFPTPASKFLRNIWTKILPDGSDGNSITNKVYSLSINDFAGVVNGVRSPYESIVYHTDPYGYTTHLSTQTIMVNLKARTGAAPTAELVVSNSIDDFTFGAGVDFLVDFSYAVSVSLSDTTGSTSYQWQWARPNGSFENVASASSESGENASLVFFGKNDLSRTSKPELLAWNPQFISLRVRVTDIDTDGFPTQFNSPWQNVDRPTTLPTNATISVGINNGFYEAGASSFGIEDGNLVGIADVSRWDRLAIIDATWQSQKTSTGNNWISFLTTAISIATQDLTEAAVSLAVTNAVLQAQFPDSGFTRLAVSVREDNWGFASGTTFYSTPMEFHSRSATYFQITVINGRQLTVNLIDPGGYLSGFVTLGSHAWASRNPSNPNLFDAISVSCATLSCTVPEVLANRDIIYIYSPYNKPATAAVTSRVFTPNIIVEGAANIETAATEIIVGTQYTVNISALRNAYDSSTGLTAALSYEWQSGDGGAVWASINMGATYNAAAANFGQVNSFLRVLVKSTLGGNTVTSVPININAASSGNVSIAFTDRPYAAPGASLTANIDNISDANGVGIFLEYVWLRRANSDAQFTIVSEGENASVYVTNLNDFTNLRGGQRPVFKVMLTHLDGFGFRNPISSEASVNLVIPRAPEGTINITPNVSNIQQHLYSASLTITRGNQPATQNDINYNWYRVSVNSAIESLRTNGAIYTVQASTFTDGWNSNYPSLVVVASFNDIFGIERTFTSFINVDIGQTDGIVTIAFDGDASPTPGLQFTAATDGLTDISGIYEYRYVWSRRLRDGDSYTLVAASRRNGKVYVLNAADFIGTETGDTPALQVQVMVTDIFGFERAFSAFQLLRPGPPITGNVQLIPPSNYGDGNSIESRVGFSVADDEQIRYLWQQVNFADQQNPRNLTGGGARSASYVIRSTVQNAENLGGWNTNYTHIRLQVVHVNAIGIEVTFTSPLLQVSQPPAVEIAITTNANITVGAPLTARVTFNDRNNADSDNFGGKISISWHTERVGGRELQASGSVYILPNRAAALNIYARVAATDGLGYTAAIVPSEQFEFVLPPTQGVATISSPTAFVNQSNYTVGVDYTSGATDGVTEYQWQQGDGASKYTNIAAATAQDFELRTSLQSNGNWNTNYDYLRALVMHTYLLNNIVTITSAPIKISRPATIEASFLPSAVSLVIGSRITISASVQDANNSSSSSGQLLYTWRDAGGSILQAQSDSSVFTITSEAQKTKVENALFAQVQAIDGLGYITTLAAMIPFANIAEMVEPYAEAALNVFNLMETSAVVGVLRSHLDSVRNPSPLALNINGVPIEGKDDLTRAFLGKENKLALEDFAIRYQDGGEQGISHDGDWSVWMRTGRSYLEGTPAVSDTRGGTTPYNYSGNSFGVYAGFDRQIGNNVRLGIGVGGSSAKIEGQIGNNNSQIDTVKRSMQSLLPYLEWQQPGGVVRLAGGVGKGKLEIKEALCNVELDMNWFFGAVSGEYQLLEVDSWEASLIGDVSYADSKTDSGICGNSVKLTPIRQHGGEWLLGGRASTRRQIGVAVFSPHLGFDMRQKIQSDLEEATAYDIVAGLTSIEGFGGFAVGIEGRMQINATAHRRDSVAGHFSYSRSNVTSSLHSGFDDNKGFIHRWQMRYQDGRSFNSIGTKIFVEHAPALDNDNTTLGGELSLTF